MKLENFIALRYIRQSRNNRDISSASIIVIVSVALAIVFYISSVSIMNGYIYGIMKLIFEVKSFHAEYPVSYSDVEARMAAEFFKEDDLVSYAGIYRESKGVLSAKGRDTGVAFFRAMPEDIFHSDESFNNGITLLEGEKSLGPNEIMISAKTAEKLRLKAGERLVYTGFFSEDQTKVTFRMLTVSGIFTTGLVEFDEQLALVGEFTGDKIFKNRVEYNVFIKLHDYRDARDFAIKYETNGFFGILTWEETNYNELTALSFEKNIIALIVIIVIIVAVLNILTTIYITILEKNEDIAILKSLGYSPGEIVFVFLLQGIYLGFIGITVGIIFGLLVMNWLNEIINFFALVVNQFNYLIYNLTLIFKEVSPPEPIEIFSKDFYLNKIYTNISLFEVVFISLITFIFSIISSIVPALQAGKIKPKEVIRNG